MTRRPAQDQLLCTKFQLMWRSNPKLSLDSSYKAPFPRVEMINALKTAIFPKILLQGVLFSFKELQKLTFLSFFTCSSSFESTKHTLFVLFCYLSYLWTYLILRNEWSAIYMYMYVQTRSYWPNIRGKQNLSLGRQNDVLMEMQS